MADKDIELNLRKNIENYFEFLKGNISNVSSRAVTRALASVRTVMSKTITDVYNIPKSKVLPLLKLNYKSSTITIPYKYFEKKSSINFPAYQITKNLIIKNVRNGISIIKQKRPISSKAKGIGLYVNYFKKDNPAITGQVVFKGGVKIGKLVYYPKGFIQRTTSGRYLTFTKNANKWELNAIRNWLLPVIEKNINLYYKTFNDNYNKRLKHEIKFANDSFINLNKYKKTA